MDEIYINTIRDFGLYDAIWQAFAVFLPVRCFLCTASCYAYARDTLSFCSVSAGFSGDLHGTHPYGLFQGSSETW